MAGYSAIFYILLFGMNSKKGVYEKNHLIIFYTWLLIFIVKTIKIRRSYYYSLWNALHQLIQFYFLYLLIWK